MMKRIALLFLILLLNGCVFSTIVYRARVNLDNDAGVGTYWGERGHYKDKGYGVEFGVEITFKSEREMKDAKKDTDNR